MHTTDLRSYDHIRFTVCAQQSCTSRVSLTVQPYYHPLAAAAADGCGTVRAASTTAGGNLRDSSVAVVPPEGEVEGQPPTTAGQWWSLESEPAGSGVSSASRGTMQSNIAFCRPPRYRGLRFPVTSRMAVLMPYLQDLRITWRLSGVPLFRIRGF